MPRVIAALGRPAGASAGGRDRRAAPGARAGRPALRGRAPRLGGTAPGGPSAIPGPGASARHAVAAALQRPHSMLEYVTGDAGASEPKSVQMIYMARLMPRWKKYNDR